MVRLKSLFNILWHSPATPFQFLNGAIKIMLSVQSGFDETRFQFLNGAIKIVLMDLEVM